MKTTFKYTFKFTESNIRLGIYRKKRTKTLSLPRELFDHYDVDGMLKAFKSASADFTYRDSTVSVYAIKVGVTEFQV